MTPDFVLNGKSHKIHDLIWGHQFECRVQQSALISRNEIKELGMVTTGNEQWDRDLMNQYVVNYMSIDKMLTFFTNGTPVQIVRSTDAKDIYEIVQYYLDYWQYEIQMSMNLGKVPYEDLIDLNEFANSVFAYARSHYVNGNSPVGALMRQAKATGLTNFAALFQNLHAKPEAGNQVDKIIRKDLALEFKKQRQGALKWK